VEKEARKEGRKAGKEGILPYLLSASFLFSFEKGSRQILGFFIQQLLSQQGDGRRKGWEEGGGKGKAFHGMPWQEQEGKGMGWGGMGMGMGMGKERDRRKEWNERTNE
jgi:hypothetical protein